jgi:hypothetical protein
MEEDAIKAKLITYVGEKMVDVESVNLRFHYDGDPYGDTVPFVVHSNQCLILDEE